MNVGLKKQTFKDFELPELTGSTNSRNVMQKVNDSDRVITLTFA